MKPNGEEQMSDFQEIRQSNPHQLTGAWFNARCGHLTGSRMRASRKRLKNGEDSSERKNLKIEILAERMTGDIVAKYVTAAMQRGTDEEPNAKAAYEAATGRKVLDVGFCQHPTIEFLGASPDGLVGDGLIEIKCPTTATHLQWIIDGGIPEEHIDQMTLQCAVTQRGWCDFVSYDSRVPEKQQLFVRRFFPTDEQIEAVEKDAKDFLAEIDGLFEIITRREMVEL
jgi:hypothetical protein